MTAAGAGGCVRLNRLQTWQTLAFFNVTALSR